VPRRDPDDGNDNRLLDTNFRQWERPLETSAIAYRVADFLKRYPPFHAVQDADLLELAARGRVRFYEANEYLVWQGEPHKPHLFVVQQGTVSLWDETAGRSVLRDVRGAGDMLGLERYVGAPACMHTAMSESDVVVYAFPAADFDELVLKHAYARAFVEADDSAIADYRWARETRDPQDVFLHDVIGEEAPQTCTAASTIREAAAQLLGTGADALAVTDPEHGVRAVITVDAFLGWIANGGRDVDRPVTDLPIGPTPPDVGPTALVTDAVLAMADARAGVVTVASSADGGRRLHAIVTRKELGRVFGDQPASILREVPLADGTGQLRVLNHRARALALQYLTSAGSVEWLARFLSVTDHAILTRLIALAGGESSDACWCVCGTAGRGESLTRHAPQLVVIAEDERQRTSLLPLYERIVDGLAACDYLPRADTPFDHAFHVASSAEWQTRYRSWVYDPVRTEMYLARPLFDLRPIRGAVSLWNEVEAALNDRVDGNFLHVLANDCLANLPPLTFFQDAVVEKSGEHSTVFRLEESALRPLVDVGRVFGTAARRVLGTSTLERFEGAGRLMPEQVPVFREAAESLRILLWQQARIGIREGTTGSELPPSLLSRHDRHVLKGCFRSILRLVEFTSNAPWFIPA
jgi:CBS domain-containing protein